MAAFPAAATAERLRAVFDALDWNALGDVYCDDGGAAFWRAHRTPALERGLDWARALAARVPRDGRSLHVGAGVAELPVMLVEALDLGREVVAVNLRTDEVALLERGLAAADVTLRWHAGDVVDLVDDRPFDHVGMVSLCTDPETYPLVAGVQYGRLHPVQLDIAAFASERDRVRAIVGTALDRLAVPGVVTTTTEEVPWVLEWAYARGLAVDADDEIVETAIVGDPLGFLQLTAEDA